MLSSPFHLVGMSPWPLVSAFAGLGVTAGTAYMFNSGSVGLLFLSLGLMLVVMFQWWRDVSREASFQGSHTVIVNRGLRIGMMLFITSEVFFFLAFFWAFFHSSLAPSFDLGSCWPPAGIEVINPFAIPLLNTAVLLASGASVTWAHHALIGGEYSVARFSLLVTIMLGGYFTVLQVMEYVMSGFTVADSVYGTTFFVATGFHGLHVIIGSSFLLVTLLRLLSMQFSSSHHFGFEAAAWYWHFVDVVWIFLFVSIYWWGSL